MPHIHLVRTDDAPGAYRYQTCRCGARRTTSRWTRGYSARRADFPPPERGWAQT